MTEPSRDVQPVHGNQCPSGWQLACAGEKKAVVPAGDVFVIR